MVYQIDSLAYSNKLRSLKTEHKLGFALSLFILSYLAPTHVQILITLWLMIWIVVYAGIPVLVYRRLLVLALDFLVYESSCFDFRYYYWFDRS